MKIFVLIFIATSGVLQAQSLRIDCLENNVNGTCTAKNLNVDGKSESIATVDSNGIEVIDDFHVFNQRVKYLPSNIGEKFPQLTSLRIERSALQNVDRSSFSKMEDLEMLSLWNNDLKSLDYDTFDDLPLLMYLDLKDNNIDELDRRIFNKLQALTTLNLDSNYLKSLDVMLFRKNKNLEHLSIQKNALKTLPITIFETLENLRILNLDNNELEGLPDQLFKTNLQLRELSVADNNIVSVGAENRDRFMNLESHNFLYNPCTTNLKQEATNEELLTLLEEKCKTEPPTRIHWLETEIEELRRSKRGDAELIECAAQEFIRNDKNINSTRDAILTSISGLSPAISASDISSIRSDLASMKTSLEKVDKSADDIMQDLKNDELNTNLKTLKELVTIEKNSIEAKIDNKTFNVKTKIIERVENVLTAIKTQTTTQKEQSDTMKTDLLAQINEKILSVNTTIAAQNTTMKTRFDKIDEQLAKLTTIVADIETLKTDVKAISSSSAPNSASSLNPPAD